MDVKIERSPDEREVETELVATPFRVNMACADRDKGCAGFMIMGADIMSYSTWPDKHTHTCNTCGRVESFSKIYPTIEWKYEDKQPAVEVPCE